MVLIFYNLPQSKRGVYLLCMYPALATLVAIYVRQAVVRPEPARACVHWIARLSGVAMLILGGGGLIALAMLVARPQEFAGLLQAAGIRAPAFPRVLTATVAKDWGLDLAMPLAVVSLGVFMIFTRPRIERMVLAIAATMVFTTVAVNVAVVPAIANTLSLRDFTDHAMKIVGDSPVGYLDELNYDVAFYSRRTIPIVSQRSPADARVPDRLAQSLQRASRVQATPLRHRDNKQPGFARRHRRDAPTSPARRFPGSAVQTLRQLHRSGNF